MTKAGHVRETYRSPILAAPTHRSAPLSVDVPTLRLTGRLVRVLACFSGRAGRWLKPEPGFAEELRWLTGGVLIGWACAQVSERR